MYQNDWADFFIENFVWEKTIRVARPELADRNIFQPMAEFVRVFPQLTRLLSQARVTRLNVDDTDYHLYGWTNRQRNSMGWLCPLPSSPVTRTELHPDHRLLLSCFGGITERWEEPLGTWLLGLNHALGEKQAVIGFGGWEDSYYDVCKASNLAPVVKPQEYISFTLEANGDRTMYHRETGQVLMYAHDCSFPDAMLLKGCPDCTLYTLRACPDFRTWVETVAEQWLAQLAEPQSNSSNSILQFLQGS